MLPNPAEVERALARVYSRPEFAPPPPSPIRDAIGRAWGWLRDAFGRLLPDGFDASGSGPVVIWVVSAVLLAATIACAVHVALLVRQRWRVRIVRGNAAEAIAAGPSATAEQWLRQADDAAARGRWREAALALYPALVLKLDRQGALRYDRSKTPGEYRRETRRNGDAHRLLDGFLRGWEPVAFGGQPLDSTGYATLRRTLVPDSAVA